MRNFTVVAALVLAFGNLFAQSGQLSIARVAQMPNLPSPYEMRDWKDVAVKYDQLIFYKTTGTYFPLIGQLSAGINYPALKPISLKTFVGNNAAAEAINIIPAVVGASLMNIDKSNQAGTDWVVKTKDFFNRANGQNVYLNNYSTTSGNDWWYDMMPNIFFYQLYTLYPATSEYDLQFTTVADRWLQAVNAMGGSSTPWAEAKMNYRAFNLMTMTGLAQGVQEPEAAGGIGWLLYHAYLKTGEKKYLNGAQQSLEFLNGLTSNPSYELQLPYGAFIAAKMNAEQGTSYNISKILNWCFDRGPLRGWGAIKGKWDNKDVSGLIGEANDGGNDYAFALNGFQQAAALVPLVKYDKRFTRDIAKWTLNVANASRFFYRPYPSSQDDYDWSLDNDPDAVIAYEALKERDSYNSNKPLNATGDAKRSGWSQTNLGLYGSSSVGYLAAVVATTDVSGILDLDLNKTDFFLANTYPMHAVYNPYAEQKTVTLSLPGGSHDIYNALAEEVIIQNASGTVQITLPAGEAALLVYIPAGSSPVPENGKLYVNNKVIDYHYGSDFTPKLRIKSLAANRSTVVFGEQVSVHLTVENAGPGVTYAWADNTGNSGTFSTPVLNWTAPSVAAATKLKVTVSDNGQTVSDSILFNVVEHIPQPPVITAITSASRWHEAGNSMEFTAVAYDDDQQPLELQYNWTAPEGALSAKIGNKITWLAPQAEGVYSITCAVTDSENLSVSFTQSLLVKKSVAGPTQPFAYYPLDGNALDFSGNTGNNHDGTRTGVSPANDARGEPGRAFMFDSNADIITVQNSTDFNFPDAVTVSFWVKASTIPEECFIISHGSWEERWKVSLTPQNRLRWTIKTNTGTKDLDSSFPVALNQFYHFTVVYSGYSMELYADGEIDAFIANNGFIASTGKAMTFGRKEVGQQSYYLRGVLDEVRIYDKALSPVEIKTLKDKWSEIVTAIENPLEKIRAFPNPAEREFFLRNTTLAQVAGMKLTDVNGRPVNFAATQADSNVKIVVTGNAKGVVILTLQEKYRQKIILK